MLHIQKILRDNNGVLPPELEIDVTYSDDGRLAIFNYSQTHKDKTHPVIMECRGVVLEANTFRCIAKPFNRFFNLGQVPELEQKFNFNSFRALEKIDGSVCIVYHYDGRWRLNTRGSFAKQTILGPNSNSPTWEGLFFPFFKNLEKVPTNLTIVAEGCSVYNKIVTHFSEPKVVMLSAVNRDTCEELSEGEQEALALLIELPTPKEYNFSSLEELKSYADAQHFEFEGFVLKDDTSKRIKYKNSNYCNVHSLKSNNNIFLPRYAIPQILNGNMDDILAKWNEYRPTIEPIIEKILAVKSQTFLTWTRVRDIVDQKSFALAIQNERHKAILFNARKCGSFEKVFLESEKILLKGLGYD